MDDTNIRYINAYSTEYESFGQFMRRHWNDLFRYWIYRRGFTPYEQDHKFSDESMYEDTLCNVAYIRECIQLSDGDILIGFLDEDATDTEKMSYIQYCKLSEIRLELYSGDQQDGRPASYIDCPECKIR